MLTIGTAGHIDHGKSSLVKALTSIDPDRLPEEKRRGMTIDLGFAWLQAASGEMIGIVDVPGHEHFISNVIPGLGGIDAALLVVAADDGWMPQTEEHVQILDLLGVTHGIVALTKVDLTDDPGWLELLEKDIAERMASTSLAGAPIVRVSCQDGTGIGELKEAIDELVLKVAPRKDIAKPRLAVDRVFTIKGSGLVVTGTLDGGCLSAGDDVIISPANLPAHIRSIESYKQRIDKAQPGSRVAINLGGVKKDDVKRGDIVLAMAKQTGTSSIVDAEVRLLPQPARPLKSNTELLVYLETRELRGRIVLLGTKTIPPAGSALAQLRFDQKVNASIGERFVIRRQSPAETIGGGVILDPFAARHKLKDIGRVTGLLKRREGLDLPQLILTELAKKGLLTRDGLLAISLYSSAEIAGCTQQLKEQGRLIVTGSYVIESGFWQEQTVKLLDILSRQHLLNPLGKGLSQAELLSQLALPREAFNYLVTTLTGAGKIVRKEDTVALATHKPELSREQEAVVKKIMGLFDESRSSPPTKKELIAQIAGSEAIVRFMCQQKMLVELGEGVLLEQKYYQSVKNEIIEFLKKKGKISIQDLHSLFGFSRKYTIPLLSNMDREGITRREGNVRVLAKRRALS